MAQPKPQRLGTLQGGAILSWPGQSAAKRIAFANVQLTPLFVGVFRSVDVSIPWIAGTDAIVGTYRHPRAKCNVRQRARPLSSRCHPVHAA
ncbi:hypothetical protein [Xanthomonas prunicola]|uniref:Uncharacterized protein n=2 Tax=Xanthomonas prunicola TaxID=2053930 RepID=A0A2N3RLD5_9XANT|nr:hypothetical protein [Xanthomonas prunicola]PKV13309.1 hypothetical protein XpruCFBP8353_08775 [Xanthomonas prunicola]PKV17586.1 hypothetical protein XpruCFBP8354_08775 [Xanthomonas prunicola]PKV21483.1 hypothetical protein CVO74_10830 [Xanthomonas prunicola]